MEGVPKPCITLEPVENLRSALHLVITDYRVRGIQEEADWNNKRFYLNRFYVDAEAIVSETDLTSDGSE